VTDTPPLPQLIAFNKPFDVLCQFRRPDPPRPTLADWLPLPDIHPAGRLDRDSEGLLLLTDSGPLQQRITHPRHKLQKRYWVQVEGIPDAAALAQLRSGVLLNDGVTRPAGARLIAEPPIWPRQPPIRWRAAIPTCWLELTLREGRNRQVRRMTAAVGYPTLRLIRYAIGPYRLDHLPCGGWRPLDPTPLMAKVAAHHPAPRRRRPNR